MFIYETCVLLNSAASESVREKLVAQTTDAVEKAQGKILLVDEWGLKTLPQSTRRNNGKGYYIYFLYRAPGEVNREVERRYRVDESVIKYIVLTKGPALAEEAIVKAYSTPYASNSAHRPSEDELTKNEKEKRLFARRKSCYFKANKVEPDWKNPYSYKWLVNEFGKISPARVTGLSARYQRTATIAIKRARCVGLVSYVGRHFAS